MGEDADRRLTSMTFFIQITGVLLISIRSIGALIEILTDKNPFVCGRNFTLTCKIENYNSAVAWMNGNDVIPIANCLRNACSLNTAYMKTYAFAYDFDEGVFNLTINKLAMKDIGRKFVCSNGFASVSHVMSFTYYKTQLIINELTELFVIIATAACVSKETKVLFKWFKINATNNFESEFIPKILYNLTEQCSDGFNCGNSTHIQRSEVISANQSGTEKYFLKIALVNGNETIESQRTSVKYNLEEQDYKDNGDSDDSINSGIIFVLLLILCTVVLLILFALIFLRQFKKLKRRTRGNPSSKPELRTIDDGGEFTNENLITRSN